MEISIQQFEAFLKVQSKGKYNMFDPMARLETGLSEEVFIYIIEHYDELMAKYETSYNYYMGGE